MLGGRLLLEGWGGCSGGVWLLLLFRRVVVVGGVCVMALCFLGVGWGFWEVFVF